MKKIYLFLQYGVQKCFFRVVLGNPSYSGNFKWTHGFGTPKNIPQQFIRAHSVHLFTWACSVNQFTRIQRLQPCAVYTVAECKTQNSVVYTKSFSMVQCIHLYKTLQDPQASRPPRRLTAPISVLRGPRIIPYTVNVHCTVYIIVNRP